MTSDKRTSVSMKGVLVNLKNNVSTVVMITIKRYMYLWHVCLVITNSCRDFGDIFQLTNWILDLGATCNMAPQILGFIPSLLEDTYKYIKFAGGYYVMAKQKGKVQIKMGDNNRDPLIATLYNVLLAPDI